MTQSRGLEQSGTSGVNLDDKTVEGFGDEWSRFDQSMLAPDELAELFDKYFHIFDWSRLPGHAQGFDAGCGSGRWAACVAPRVGRLHVVDASDRALAVARRNLAPHANVSFHHASIDRIPLEAGSMDFGYSLGVLHHMPDTAAGLRDCVSRLKPGAPFLVYLYYAFDNRPAWYRGLWRASELLRKIVSRLPSFARYAASQIAAVTIYWPLARFAALAERLGMNVASFPLAFYRDRSFYTMRTDALDRLGTRLEQRFTRSQIQQMMEDAGLEQIRFSERAPFWCALGYRRPAT
jgi:SAM-dependent methyltransferase